MEMFLIQQYVFSFNVALKVNNIPDNTPLVPQWLPRTARTSAAGLLPLANGFRLRCLFIYVAHLYVTSNLVYVLLVGQSALLLEDRKVRYKKHDDCVLKRSEIAKTAWIRSGRKRYRAEQVGPFRPLL